MKYCQESFYYEAEKVHTAVHPNNNWLALKRATSHMHSYRGYNFSLYIEKSFLGRMQLLSASNSFSAAQACDARIIQDRAADRTGNTR